MLGTIKRPHVFGQDGFSLVEIAIVLVVVGLLVSGGLLGLAPVLDSSKVTQTNAQMDKIEQALALYVIQNGCLPCPSVPTVSPITGSASDSGTGAYSTGCNSNGTTTNTCTSSQGAVPWVNLGLSRDDVLDAYGDYIDYAVAAGLNGSSTSMVRTPPSTYPTPTTSLNVQNAAGTTQTTVSAAYVLISHGKDRSYAYHPGGTATMTDPTGPATAPNLQSCNTSARTICVGGSISNAYYVLDKSQGTSATTGYFDDIVRFKTAPVIIQSCGSNACGNPA